MYNGILQLVFTMGVLIGVSLCIAGTVLRKSAARNLQVLVYIGAMVSLVSALLLCIQCNARKNAKNRKKALWNAKRAPIQMETLNIHSSGAVLPQQSMVVVQENRTQRWGTAKENAMPLITYYENVYTRVRKWGIIAIISYLVDLFCHKTLLPKQKIMGSNFFTEINISVFTTIFAVVWFVNKNQNTPGKLTHASFSMSFSGNL